MGTDFAKSQVDDFLSVDLSNYNSAGIITSERFIATLDAYTRNTIMTVVQHSGFRTMKEFRKSSHLRNKCKLAMVKTLVILGIDSKD